MIHRESSCPYTKRIQHTVFLQNKKNIEMESSVSPRFSHFTKKSKEKWGVKLIYSFADLLITGMQAVGSKFLITMEDIYENRTWNRHTNLSKNIKESLLHTFLGVSCIFETCYTSFRFTLQTISWIILPIHKMNTTYRITTK